MSGFEREQMQTKILITGEMFDGTGSEMSVYALEAYTAIRHVMVAN